MQVPGDIRTYDLVLVDHLLEMGFAYSPPQEIAIPENVTVLFPGQIQTGAEADAWAAFLPPQPQGVAEFWWWVGVPVPMALLGPRGVWLDTSFRQRVVHFYRDEPQIWAQVQRELELGLDLFVARAFSIWIS